MARLAVIFGVLVLAMGSLRAQYLEVEDVIVGTGQAVESGDKIFVHYTGWLASGKKFDSSRDAGTPLKVSLGSGNVIQGWDRGLVGMQVGGLRRLTIPPEQGYGERGWGDVIPPNSTLIFEVELLSIED